MNAPIDILGLRVGRLLVVEPASRKGGRHWKVVCDCGTEKVLPTSVLTSKRPTKSCGCLLSPNLVGRRFGKGVVLRLLRRKQ